MDEASEVEVAEVEVDIGEATEELEGVGTSDAKGMRNDREGQ
jgi:hypothetical protein